MSFELIDDDTLYLIRKSGGAYVNRVWVDGVETVSQFQGNPQPYNDGNESLPMITGVEAVEVLHIFTQSLLFVADSELNILGDIICLEDPRTTPTAKRYLLKQMMPWVKSATSFDLIPSYREYIGIRERAD